MEGKTSIFDISSFSSIIKMIVLESSTIALLIIAKRLVNLLFWIIFVSLVVLFSSIIVILYLKPISNIRNKGKNYFDVFVLSFGITSLIIGIFCIPGLEALIIEDCWYFSISMWILSFLFLILFSIRMLIITKFKSESTANYRLVDLKNNIFPKNINDCFINDEAVCEDALNRSDITNAIYKAVTSYQGQDCIMVCLDGKWGSGKTTCLNIALKQVKQNHKNDYIICDDFKIWSCEDTRSALTLMLGKLYQCLNIGLSGDKIKDSLEKYADIFQANSKTSFLSNLFSFETEDSNSIIKVINEYLIKNNKKIIFIIDNLDRALRDNIVFVYKAISEMFGLKRIVYVCLYDSDVIMEKTELKLDFLDKITNVSIHIPPVSKKNMYYIGNTILNNYIQNYSLDDITDYGDRNIIEEIFKNCSNLRELIIIFNNLFSFFAKNRKEKNMVDLMATLFLKRQPDGIFDFIKSNATKFVDIRKELLDNYEWVYKDVDKIKEEKELFINDNFSSGKRFEKYKNLVNELFPHSLDPYISISTDLMNVKSEAENRIFSGKYFDLYFGDSSIDYLSANSRFKEILTIDKKEELFNQLDNVFKSYDPSDHSELLITLYSIIVEYNLSNNKCIDILQYFDSRFFVFNDFTGFLQLSSRDRCAILISKLLTIINYDEAKRIILKNANDFSKIMYLSAIHYWIRKDEEIKKDSNDLAIIIKKTLDDLCNLIVTKNEDVYIKNYYTKGVTGALLSYNKNKTIDFLKKIICRRNIFVILNDFINVSVTSDREKPYILKIDCNAIESTIGIEKVNNLIAETKIESLKEQIIKNVYEDCLKQLKEGVLNINIGVGFKNYQKFVYNYFEIGFETNE